jgi:hypothetical protein
MNIRIREDLFEVMPPLLDILVKEDDKIQVIEPEILYIRTVINIDLSKE